MAGESVERELKRFLYSKEVAPNDVLWLVLGLPIKDGEMKYLKLNIAETLVMGFGNSGIHLKTNHDGYVSWSHSSLDECLWRDQNLPTPVIAYEKETCLKLCPGEQSDWGPERYTFEGHVAVALNKSNYEKCMTQIYKELNIVQRQFRVQFHVPIKHQKYHRFAFKRMFYQLHGKSTLLAVRSIDGMDIPETPLKETYDKPWRQSKKSEAKFVQKHFPPLSTKKEEQECEAETPNRESPPPLKQQSSEGTLVPPQSEIDAPQQTNASPDAIKRLLKPLIPKDSITQEIPLNAAPILLELTARVANHMGAIFKKQVTHLVLDFVKNSSDEYVLIDILGFQFSGYGPDIERSNGTSGRVLPLSSAIQHKIEHYYRCRLNGTRFHGSHRHREQSNLSDDETDSDDSTLSPIDHLSHTMTAQKDTMKASHTITPQTLTCRMCTRKIAPGSIRYLLTSVMLHSTVVHLRSRLPPEDLPEFCRDRSVTMKSMQRLDDISSSASLASKKLDVTESDLVTCEHCYALYKSESKLMEVEHKLAKFTRTAGSDSSKFDLRKKISKPLLSQPVMEITTAPFQPPHKRQSVSGGNILTRPLSAPLLMTSAVSSQSVPSPAGRTQLPKATPPRGNLNFSRTSTLTSFESDSLLQLPPSAQISSPPPQPSQTSKESRLRDTFRAKNSPARTNSRDFYQTASPLKRTHSQGAERKENGILEPEKRKVNDKVHRQKVENDYPLVSSIPIGRQVTRADVMSQPMTLGRMMVAIHKVADLPVIFLDAYENFHISYVALGRRRDAPCMKNFTFTRNRANRFKNRYLTRATTNFGRILEGDEESSSNSSTSSSHGTSLCSDPSSGYSEDEAEEEDESKENMAEEEDEDQDEEDLYPITKRTSQIILKEKLQGLTGSGGDGKKSQQEEEEEEEDEPEICVGALDVKYMRMSYFMIPGDAREENNSHFNNFVNKSGRLLVVLCAQLKPNAVIDERHWNLPDESNSAKAKALKFRKEIYTLRREQQRLLRLPSRRSQSMDELEQSADPLLRYDPRADLCKTTDTGDPLPADAIGYAYISLAQLKCSAVKRLDIGASLTYAIKHLPKERSVPLMRAMVGIDRPVYPMDNWSLPYSLVELQNEKNLYVAEFEDQFTSTTPLPPEWLSVEIERNLHKRTPNLGPTATATGTFILTPGGPGNISQGQQQAGPVQGHTPAIDLADKLNTLVRAQVAADIDGHKRAPTLYVSAGRVERMTMATQLQPIVKLELTVDSEQKMERLETSVWCLCIQILQARHLALKEDIFSEIRPVWICSYDFFGEVICVKGEISADDFDEGVISFGTGTTSKHLFRGSIDAVEAMFQNNPPLKFQMETVILSSSSSSTLGGNREAPTLAAKSLLLNLSTEASSPSNLKKLNVNKSPEEKRAMVGTLGLDMQEERFVDMTVQLHPVTSSSSPAPSSRASQRMVSATPHQAPLYPPYLNVNVKFFRMGPHEDTIHPEHWLPPQTRLGGEISKCVTRVLPVEFGSKTARA